MNISEQKEALRNSLLKTRENLTETYYNEASEEIVTRLQTLPYFRKSRTIHCYVSMNSRREVNTHAFLRWILASNKRVVVPISDFDATELHHVELHSFEALKSNKWGVLEPTDGIEVSPKELDLVVVPMVGADLQCNRIGYGKGFYDRFLSKVNCPTAGLCFEKCIVEEIPTESFDVRLSTVITEERIINGD